MSSADHPPHPLAQSPTQLIVPSPSRGSGTIHDTQLPSPSPKKPPPSSSTADSSTHSNNNLLGLGLPTTVAAPSVLAAYPHLGHYIYNLLSAAASPPRATTLAAAPSHHPLSVSSSGESSASDEDESGGDKDDEEVRQKTPKKQTTDGAQGVNKDALVKQIVRLLDDEEEEEVKDLLRPHMGDSGKDDILMDQVCLDCMHRRRDDVENVPYASHLTPTRTRSSASVNTVPLRPFTPTRLPSFRARTPIGRPQSPSTLAAPSGGHTPTLGHPPHALSRTDSGRSPTIPHGTLSSSGYSSSGSPVASPRMLNAKAATFSPYSRTVSAPLSSVPPVFSPSDPWKDAPAEAPRSASPFGAVGPPPLMARTSSNLAIAAPLFSDQSSPFHSPLGTPNRGNVKMPDMFSSPALPRSSSRGIIPDDDDDDEFSPFGSGLPKLHHQDSAVNGLNLGAKPFEISDNSHYGSSTTLSSSMPHSESDQSNDSLGSGASSGLHDQSGEEDAGSGMTPLDVLSSVFSTIPRTELEDALQRSGYDFEGAMAILVSSHTLPRSGSSTPQRVSSPRPLLAVGGRGAMPLNHAAPRDGYFLQGGRTYSGNLSPGYGGTRSPGGAATRMCRYFLAGECRRSDCRFSHDIDRALCRFWLRGHCAKGPNCEFLHQFPNGFDPTALSNAMAHVELEHDGSAQHSPSSGQYGQPPDEFPDLLAARLGRSSNRFDPSRNRFANAVKRPVPAAITTPTVQITGARQQPFHGQAAFAPAAADSRTSALAVPRPSQRLKLRPPTLLPTLRTGTGANEQYMSNRATAIRLGHARNACLARAADAFRRGDGAAAKRFSREGKALNERMLNEAAEVAQSLVRERRQDAQRAIRGRDTNWSDDPKDKSERGRECAGGLGVIMGIASKRNVVGGERLSPEERTECLLDLHTLHGTEGADILGYFLSELEKENYRGLAYIVVGEEKHMGTQDPLRGASKVRLASSIKQCLAEWGCPWNATAGVICVDACR